MIKKFVGMGLEPIRCNGNKDSLREERSRTDGPLVHPLTKKWISAGATFVGMGLAPIRPIDK